MTKCIETEQSAIQWSQTIAVQPPRRNRSQPHSKERLPERLRSPHNPGAKTSQRELGFWASDRATNYSRTRREEVNPCAKWPRSWPERWPTAARRHRAAGWSARGPSWWRRPWSWAPSCPCSAPAPCRSSRSRRRACRSGSPWRHRRRAPWPRASRDGGDGAERPGNAFQSGLCAWAPCAPPRFVISVVSLPSPVFRAPFFGPALTPPCSALGTISSGPT